MPMSIIIAYSKDTEAKALAEGFKPQTVLVRNEFVMSNDTKARESITSNVLHVLRPYQYALTDYWGMGNGD